MITFTENIVTSFNSIDVEVQELIDGDVSIALVNHEAQESITTIVTPGQCARIIAALTAAIRRGESAMTPQAVADTSSWLLHPYDPSGSMSVGRHSLTRKIRDGEPYVRPNELCRGETPAS